MKTVDEAVLEKAIKALVARGKRGDGSPDTVAALRCALAQQEQEPVAISHNHEWFRTGGMKPGQFRCIHCGTWAQEQQDPSAYKITGKLGDICHFKSSSVRKGDVVYTLSPRVEKEQEPMPRWKIDELMRDAGWQNSAIRQADLDKVEKVVRAVEQALKEKNHA